MLTQKIKTEKCPNCGEEAVYYSTKQKCSIWKIYVNCSKDDGGCSRDFGRIGVVKRKNIDHTDQMEEKAQNLVN